MAEQVNQEIHERIAKLLREIEEETGVVVERVRADWLSAETPEKDKHVLIRIGLETHRRAG